MQEYLSAGTKKAPFFHLNSQDLNISFDTHEANFSLSSWQHQHLSLPLNHHKATATQPSIMVAVAQLLADNPTDDSIASSLYAFRIGLCSMVRTGMIDTDRAIRLLEQLRATVIREKLEVEGTGGVEL